MKENKLHSGGMKEHKKELMRKKDEELREVDELLVNEKGKKTLIERIKLKFRELLKQSDDSLYLSD